MIRPPITPLDPESAKGREVAARLTDILADLELAVAARQRASRRQAKQDAA